MHITTLTQTLYDVTASGLPFLTIRRSKLYTGYVRFQTNVQAGSWSSNVLHMAALSLALL